MRKFSAQARAVKLCWALEDLVLKKGYAFCGNDYLAQITGISVKYVDETLTILEAAGAIVRKTWPTPKGRARHIYLGLGVILGNPPKSRGMARTRQSPRVGGIGDIPANPPDLGPCHPPDLGGIEAKEGAARPEESPPQEIAEARSGARLQAHAPPLDSEEDLFEPEDDGLEW